MKLFSACALIVWVVLGMFLSSCETGPTDSQACAAQENYWGCMSYMQSERQSQWSSVNNAMLLNQLRYSQQIYAYPTFCNQYGCY